MVNTRYSYILKSSYMSKYAYLLYCIGVQKRGEGRGERGEEGGFVSNNISFECSDFT